MANNIVDTREGSSPWSQRFGEKFKGPLVPFGLRIDYWIGPKNKAKSSLRFEPTSNPGIFLGYPPFSPVLCGERSSWFSH